VLGKHPGRIRKNPAHDDAAWYWFVCDGPHGERFQWASHPVLRPGGDLRLLRKSISEIAAARPEFESHARAIAVDSLQSEDIALVLKAIHVLAAIGTDAEMQMVIPLTEATNADVAKHARAALFERGIKVKNK
jgi:hypothetical protein